MRVLKLYFYLAQETLNPTYKTVINLFTITTVWFSFQTKWQYNNSSGTNKIDESLEIRISAAVTD